MSQQTPDQPNQRNVTTIEKQVNKPKQVTIGSNNNNSGVVVLAIVAVVVFALLVLFDFKGKQDAAIQATRQAQEIAMGATQTEVARSTDIAATRAAILALTPTATSTPPPTYTPTFTPTPTHTETPTPTPTPEMAVIAVDQPLARQLILQRVTVYQPAWIGLFLNENCISRKGDNEYVGHSKVEPGSTVDVPVQIHEPQYGRIVNLLQERLALPLTACLLWRQPSEAETSQPIRVRGIPVGITFFVAEAGSNQP
mgnify:CR=1 FL=1